MMTAISAKKIAAPLADPLITIPQELTPESALRGRSHKHCKHHKHHRKSCQCPQGPTGPQGLMGPQGATGLSGPTGAQGPGLTTATFNNEPITSVIWTFYLKPAGPLIGMFQVYVTTPDGRTFSTQTNGDTTYTVTVEPPFYNGNYIVGVILPGNQTISSSTLVQTTVTSITTSAGTTSVSETVALIYVPDNMGFTTPQQTSISQSYAFYPPAS
jgi:hypothetical protein